MGEACAKAASNSRSSPPRTSKIATSKIIGAPKRSSVALLYSGVLLVAGSRRKLVQDPDQLGVRE